MLSGYNHDSIDKPLIATQWRNVHNRMQAQLMVNNTSHFKRRRCDTIRVKYA